MRESRTYGCVRGARGSSRPYREKRLRGDRVRSSWLRRRRHRRALGVKWEFDQDGLMLLRITNGSRK
jgi:hypothetical protein